MKPTMLLALPFVILTQATGELRAAGLEWVPGPSPQVVFEGKERPIRGTFRNSGANELEVHLRVRLWLTSSRTAVPLGPSQMRQSFRVPAGQTILENVRIDFPEVKGKSTFILEWMDAQDRNIGKTHLIVFPPVLLRELKTLAGDSGLGILDPRNRIKPWLEKSQVSYTDLEKDELERFTGKLVIFDAGFREDERTPKRLLSKAESGTPVLWIRHRGANVQRLEPSTFVKTTSSAPLVVTDAALFANFADDPTAHLNLVRLARWAVLGEKMDLTNNDL